MIKLSDLKKDGDDYYFAKIAGAEIEIMPLWQNTKEWICSITMPDAAFSSDERTTPARALAHALARASKTHAQLGALVTPVNKGKRK